jgi:IPT/TIG domain-containing protein
MDMKEKLSNASRFVPPILLIVVVLIYWKAPKPEAYYSSAYGWGFIALGAVWLLIWFLTERINPFNAVIGADGRPSTSKLKPFLWFLVVFFSYSVLYAARVKKGETEAVPEIPVNLLLALGFSIGTWVAAKSITESQLASGQISKPPVTDSASPGADSDTAGVGAIVQDDKGFPDLAKIQTVGWTLLAIVVYLVSVDRTLRAILGPTPLQPMPFLPDIDSSLMVLTGLGDAAYLGKKLVTTRMPVISRLSPNAGKVGTEVTIIGSAFGANQLGSKITIDGAEFNGKINAWNDTEIKFEIPSKHPKDGSDLTAGKIIQIGLVVNGQESNKLPLTIAA